MQFQYLWKQVKDKEDMDYESTVMAFTWKYFSSPSDLGNGLYLTTEKFVVSISNDEKESV